jgi:hypothetical protein
MTDHDLQMRAAELIERSIESLMAGLGCTHINALKLLLIQASIRLSDGEGLQILQRMHEVERDPS